MSVKFRSYSHEPFFTDDYRKVRNFLIRINAEKLTTPRMLWGAWEWAVTHGGRDQENLLEPLVTDPDYRKMGLGKAVVHEAARRCGELGAKQMLGAINQKFYCNIGLYPVCTYTKWILSA